MASADDRVLIAGAGPVGLVLALSLAGRGHRVLVVEKLVDLLDQVRRAGTIHAATLEMLDDIGLCDRLEPRGLVAPLLHYWDRGDPEPMGMNSGIHDAVNLAAKLSSVRRGDAGDELLDRYVRQRRHVAVTHVQAITIRNKKLMAESDPEVRRRNRDELRRAADDPALAREFLRRASLISSVREAAEIG